MAQSSCERMVHTCNNWPVTVILCLSKPIPVGRYTRGGLLIVQVFPEDVAISHVAWQQRLELHRDPVRVNGVDVAEFVGGANHNEIRLAIL